MPILDARSLAEWTGGQWRGGVPARLTGVCTDSRTLAPGCLFIALRGLNFDGHVFVAEALRKGAAGAVVQESAAPRGSLPQPILCVADTSRALRDMAGAYRRQIRAEITAITGSVGKTTVKEMVADVLARRWPTARTRGNWNNEVGLPLSLLAMEADVRMGVFELGVNHPGELLPLVRMLRPDWGLITAIGPVHLEFFKSVEAIAREKGSLLQQLPPGGVALLNRDDPFYDSLCALAPCRVLSVSLSGAADYQAEFNHHPAEGVRMIERASGESVQIRLPLPGAHQAANALFAVAVGRAHGVGWDDIRAALEAFRSQPMRWEQQTVAGVRVVNDAYNANPVSMAAALRTFASLPAPGRRWLVLAGMLELGEMEIEWHRKLGSSLAHGPWAGMITVGSLGKVIAEAAVGAGMDAARVFPCADHARAARALAEQVRPGDAVLFKASRGQRLEQVLALWKERIEPNKTN